MSKLQSALNESWYKEVFKGAYSNPSKRFLESAPLEYLFLRIFILNEALWSFSKFKKIIVEFKIGSLEYPSVSSFILNKTFSSFETKFAPKKYFGDQLWEMKSPSTLFSVTIKQFTRFWVIVGHSMNILGHCGPLWFILAHSTV